MSTKLMDAGGSLELNITGIATPSSSPSLKNKAEGQGIYFEKIDFIIAAGATDGTCTSVSPFSGSIIGSSSKIKDKQSGSFAVLDGDNVDVSIPGILSGGSACTISAKITAKANQTKVQEV